MTEAIRDYVRAGALLAALAVPALFAVANPTPWSPMGVANTVERAAQDEAGFAPIDLSQFDIPEGWAPAPWPDEQVPATFIDPTERAT